MECVYSLVGRCPSERPYDATDPAVLNDGTDAQARAGAERTVERMAGFSSEQREGVVTVDRQQLTAQVPCVGRVALALTFTAVRINAEVHEAMSRSAHQ
jgi:hypothetical protein